MAPLLGTCTAVPIYLMFEDKQTINKYWLIMVIFYRREGNIKERGLIPFFPFVDILTKKKKKLPLTLHYSLNFDFGWILFSIRWIQSRIYE